MIMRGMLWVGFWFFFLSFRSPVWKMSNPINSANAIDWFITKRSPMQQIVGRFQERCRTDATLLSRLPAETRQGMALLNELLKLSTVDVTDRHVERILVARQAIKDLRSFMAPVPAAAAPVIKTEPARHERFLFHDILPSDLSSCILREWTAEVADISRLDIACTNRGARPFFLQLLMGVQAPGTVRRDTYHYWRWLRARGMYIGSQCTVSLLHCGYLIDAKFLHLFKYCNTLRLNKTDVYPSEPSVKLQSLNKATAKAFFGACSKLEGIELVDFAYKDPPQRRSVHSAVNALPTLVDCLLENLQGRIKSLVITSVEEKELLRILAAIGPTLTSIDFNDNYSTKFSAEVFQALPTHCPGLEFLEVSTKNTSKRVFPAIMGLPHLKTLHHKSECAEECIDYYSNQQLQSILQSHPQLEELHITMDYGDLDYTALAMAFRHCPHLHKMIDDREIRYRHQRNRCELDIYCSANDMGSLWNVDFPVPLTRLLLLERASRLEVLQPLVERHGCNLATVLLVDAYQPSLLVDCIVAHCPRLQSFSFEQSYKGQRLRREKFQLLADTYGAQLKELICRSCTDIRDSTVLYIADRCPNLERVDLHHCRLISDDAFGCLLQKCPSIRSLIVTGCSLQNVHRAELVIKHRLFRPFRLGELMYEVDGKHIFLSRIAEAVRATGGPDLWKQYDFNREDEPEHWF